MKIAVIILIILVLVLVCLLIKEKIYKKKLEVVYVHTDEMLTKYIAENIDMTNIHYMIETEPTMSVSKIVNLMKSYTTYHIWERYPNYLRKHFWKEHIFWTDGYFACSVGNVSEEMLKRYIENQG